MKDIYRDSLGLVEFLNHTYGKHLFNWQKRDQSRTGSIDFDLIPSSYIDGIIRRNNYNIWNERWTSSTKGETTRKYFPTIEDRVKVKKWF
jgi:hypothetical protein